MFTVSARISPTATAAMAVIAPLSDLDALLEIVDPSVIVALVSYKDWPTVMQLTHAFICLWPHATEPTLPAT